MSFGSGQRFWSKMELFRTDELMTTECYARNYLFFDKNWLILRINNVNLDLIKNSTFLYTSKTCLISLIFRQTFFLLVNEKSLLSNSLTISQIYNQEKEDDGFLYIVYASQPAFG